MERHHRLGVLRVGHHSLAVAAIFRRRQANLLLDLEIEELRLKNILDHASFPNVSSIHVKITPLNDPDAKRLRMEEVKILSDGLQSSLG